MSVVIEVRVPDYGAGLGGSLGLIGKPFIDERTDPPTEIGTVLAVRADVANPGFVLATVRVDSLYVQRVVGTDLVTMMTGVELADQYVPPPDLGIDDED